MRVVMRKRFTKAATLNCIVVINLDLSPFPCLDSTVSTGIDIVMTCDC